MTPRKAGWALGTIVAGTSAVLAGQGGPGAQQPRPSFRGGTELVQVDVVVTDADGTPVTGLKAADFTLLDRKKPQAIEVFDEVSHSRTPNPFAALPASVPLDVADNSGTHANRLVILLLDDLNTWQGRTERVRALARRVVADLGSEASMAVLFTSGDHGTEITSNRAALFAEIEKFKGWHRLPYRVSAPKCGGVNWDVDRIHKTMQDVSRMLGMEVTRRKAFVFVSEGVIFTRGKLEGGIKGLFETMSEIPGCPLNQPPHNQYALLDAMEAMRRANVVTYAIDPSALLESSAMVLPQDRERVEKERLTEVNYDGLGDRVEEGGQFLWERASFLGREYLSEVSEASGGFALVNEKDFDTGLGRLLNELDHYYVLGFSPADTKSKGYRRIEVTVNRPGMTVRYRRGYQIGKTPKAPKNQSPLVALSAGVLPQNRLPMRMHAAAFPGPAGRSRVPLELEVSVPRAAVQASDASVGDDIRYSVLVVDMKSKKVKSQITQGARFTLRPNDPAQPASETVTYQIGLVLDLTPGRYQLRASTMTTRLGQGGSVYLPLDVPDFAKTPLALSGPLLGYTGGPRVAAMTTAARESNGPASFTSTLDRGFTRADDVSVYFEVSRRTVAAISGVVEAIDAAGTVASRVQQEIPASAAGAMQMRVPLSDLEPGPYRLRVSVADGSLQAFSEIAILVR